MSVSDDCDDGREMDPTIRILGGAREKEGDCCDDKRWINIPVVMTANSEAEGREVGGAQAGV